MSVTAEIEPGSLLVATPRLLDPNFCRTVVYIIEHRADGTLGVILNQPSDVAISEVLPGWEPWASEPAVVFIGGPVEQKTALCLANLKIGENPAEITDVIGVRGPVVLVDLDADPEELAVRFRGLRIFAGYAGWSAGQLAQEIARGDWIVVSALPGDMVSPPGVDLWGRVLRRQGLPLALLATHPIDIRQN